MHKCTSYSPEKLNLWPFWPLFDPYDLDLQPTWKNVSNGTSPPGGQQLCKIILKSIQKCTIYGPDKLNIWPFWPLFDPCDLDLQHTWKNISNGTSPPQGQQLCKIILKFMNKCTSYAPDKLNTWIWPFWPLFDPCDLDLSTYLKKMFQMALLLLKGNNCAKLFRNPCIIVQVMVQTSLDRHTHIHRTKIVTTISRLPASGLNKKESTLNILNIDISKYLKSTLLYQRIHFGYISYFHSHFISYHFKLLISQSKFSGTRKFTLRYQ